MPFSFDPGSTPPLSRTRTSFGVFRFEGGTYLPLPNVVCVSISARIGAEPWGARFRYKFDQRLDPTVFPRSFEQVFTFSAGPLATPYVIRNEDRIVVVAFTSESTWEVIFDGFALLPQIDFGNGEEVTFEAIGTPGREWDEPIPGAAYRDADSWQTGKAFFLDLPTRFNPDGIGNCTAAGFDATFAGVSTPIFIDARVVKARPTRGRKWTLANAVRYLIVYGNGEETYTRRPDLDALDDLLVAVRPTSEDTPIDWANSSTFSIEPIICPDVDLTGAAWPEAVERLIEPHGFLAFFDLETDGAGLPIWRYVIRRRDDNRNWLTVALQPPGATLNPGATALQGMRLQRDVSRVGNEIKVETAPERYQAFFVLSPLGWSPAAGDVSDGNRPNWKRGSTTFDPVKYRVYGFDETGEGHWDFATNANSTTATGLAKLFSGGDESKGFYVRRRRPGSGDLLETDNDGKPKPAELWFIRLADYAGPVPGVWTGAAGTWQRVNAGNWRLLPDRLGIEITAPDVAAWVFDEGTPVSGGPVKSTKLNLVRSQASPDAANPRIVFALKTVIEGDLSLAEGWARKQLGSPSRFTIRRHVDARDRYRRDRIYFHAENQFVNVRDDSTDARNYAISKRREGEAAKIAGAFTIPRFTRFARLGDKLTAITGRGLFLQSNIGNDAGEGPRYPTVVGIEWSIDRGEATQLILDDRRAEIRT